MCAFLEEREGHMHVEEDNDMTSLTCTENPKLKKLNRAFKLKFDYTIIFYEKNLQNKIILSYI